MQPLFPNRSIVVGRFLAAAGLAFWLARLAGLGAEPATNSFRLGISHASFGTASRNDATAALKAWVASVSKERGLKLDVQVEVFEDEGQLRQALSGRLVDALTMTTAEFVHSEQKPEAIILPVKGGAFTEQYVLVARRDSGLDDVPALKGRKLVRHNGPATGPALAWLETVFAARGLEPVRQFLSEVTALESPAKAVLRVFFRQSDACLVTTNAFALAGELNPQLLKELKTIIVSPPLIPAVFFFRPDYDGPIRAQLETAILDLHSTPAGQQVLTVFQGSRMERRPVACLDTTIRMLADYERLQPGSPVSSPGPGSQAIRSSTP
jgi:ABC-type phosphate/phosphonate transport system substrate-binding protein